MTIGDSLRTAGGVARSASNGIKSQLQKLGILPTVELLVALFGFALPFLVTRGQSETYACQDGDAATPLNNCRDSISAYYDSADPRWFYMLLTIYSGTFLVNWAIRFPHHAVNGTLAFSLLALTIWDHEEPGGILGLDSLNLHYLAAVIFFAVALWWSWTFMWTDVRGHAPPTWKRGLAIAAGALVVIPVAALVLLLGDVWGNWDLYWTEVVLLYVLTFVYIVHAAIHTDRGRKWLLVRGFSPSVGHHHRPEHPDGHTKHLHDDHDRFDATAPTRRSSSSPSS